MKKILIIAQSFPPVNLISSRRAEAYANYFHLYGFYPTVVTELKEATDSASSMNWKWHSATEPVRHQKNDRFELYELPRVNTITQKLITFSLKLPILKSLTRLILIKTGNAAAEQFYSYQKFRSFLLRHTKAERYDYILASYKPEFPLKLAYEIAARSGTPIIADYRDLWLNRMSHEDNKLNRAEKIIDKASRKLHRKWLSKALFFVIVSEPWRQKLEELTGFTRGHVITNGFEVDTFRNNNTTVDPNTFFITYTGYVYTNKNDFSFFYKAFNGFIKGLNEEDKARVKLRFYTHEFSDMAEIKAQIPAQNLEINGWVTKNEVVNRLKESAVLLTFGFTNQRGRYPGKVFEYLGAERNILITPSDNSVLHDLIAETGAGFCSSDMVATTAFLKQKFLEWKNTGAPAYHGDLARINNYSRESQVKKVAELIGKYSNNG